MKAAEIKQFFKKHFDIPVRVRTVAVKRPFVQIWIPCGDGMTYSHRFPDQLGNHCVKIIYGADSTLANQNWAGNTQPYSLSLDAEEWAKLQAIYEPQA